MKEISYSLIGKLKIEQTDFETPQKKFLVFCGKKQFYTGFLIKEIIECIGKEYSIPEIHKHLEKYTAYEKLTLEQLEQIIESKIEPLGILGEDKSKGKKETAPDTDSIKIRKTLFNQTQTYVLANLFTFLYNQWIAVFLILLGLLAYGFYFLDHSFWAEHTKIWIETSALEYILLYFLIIGVFVFHEVGHAAAALRFDIKAPRIGYGFYLVYPVFFTEITQAWKLSPQKRMLINLGGIYFQWIAGIFFILLDYLDASYFGNLTSIWSAIVMFNIMRMLYSFIPFMKADGYWIFSDGFGITNLRKKSNQLLGLVLQSFDWKKAREIVETRTQFYALLFFSIGTVMFFAFWFFFIGYMVATYGSALPSIVEKFYNKWQDAVLFSEYAKVVLQFTLLAITILGIFTFLFRLFGLLKFGVKLMLNKQKSHSSVS